MAVNTISDAEREAGVTYQVGNELAHKEETVSARPLVLMPVLKALVHASSAFSPLQSAAGGLLKVIEVVEVRNYVSLKHHGVSHTAFLCETDSRR